MKGKKYGIIVSVITMLIALVLILLVNWRDNETYEVLSNILIGVLGSSIVTLIISISDYIVAKREALEDYYCQAGKIITAFGQIKYIHITEKMLESAKYKTTMNLSNLFDVEETEIENMLKYYEQIHYWDNFSEVPSNEVKIQLIKTETEKDCMEIIKGMNSYLQFEELSLQDVENAFGRISFLINNSPKKFKDTKYFKVWLYINFFEKLMKMLYRIRIENNCFKAYKDRESSNLFVVAQKINELNEQLFEIKTETNEEYMTEKVYAKFFDDMCETLEKFRTKIYGCDEKQQFIVPIYTREVKINNTGSET